VSCLSHRGIDCQICRDGCPQDAIRFPPRPGGPFRPLVRADACTGCGVCVEACPVSAIGLDRTGADADA
jgi:ferredoxin-type protein NapF